MKNKKMVFGTMLLLFVITGICNISNSSAFTDSIYIPPLSYAWYSMDYLENRDEILINEIDSDGSVDVYIMNDYQFNTLQDSGGLIWNYVYRWQNVILLSGWTFDIHVDDYYYIVISNEAFLTGRNVYVDIDVRYYTPPAESDNFFLGWLLFIILPAIAVVVIVAVIVRKRKGKITEEDIKPERIPIKVYCSKCGIEIVDKSRKFCSNCGTKIIK